MARVGRSGSMLRASTPLQRNRDPFQLSLKTVHVLLLAGDGRVRRSGSSVGDPHPEEPSSKLKLNHFESGASIGAAGCGPIHLLHKGRLTAE